MESGRGHAVVVCIVSVLERNNDFAYNYMEGGFHTDFEGSVVTCGHPAFFAEALNGTGRMLVLITRGFASKGPRVPSGFRLRCSDRARSIFRVFIYFVFCESGIQTNPLVRLRRCGQD